MSFLDHFVSFLAGITMTTPKRQRDRPMEVLCLGCPRTGTESLCKALKILGYYNAYHGFEIYHRFSDWVLWNKAAMAKFKGVGTFDRREWDDILGDCMALSDLPCIEAKVILTTRAVEDWIASCRGVMPGTLTLYSMYFFSFFYPKALVATHTFVWQLGLQEFSTLSDEGLRARYFEHNAMIRGLVPKERLLEYHVSQGWEPLCQFLGKSLPEQSMPRGNSVKEFKESEGRRRYLLLQKGAWHAAAVCIALIAGIVTIHKTS